MTWICLRIQTRPHPYTSHRALIADTDRAVRKGDLQPIWRRVVRKPEFWRLVKESA